mgnify:CR=1 FL=1
MIKRGYELLKTEDIYPPKTGDIRSFSWFLTLMAMRIESLVKMMLGQ